MLDSGHSCPSPADHSCLPTQNWVQVSKPEQLPFNSSAIPKRYASAALFKRVHVANWFHTFTEDGANLFNLFCSYLGLCSYAAFHEPNKVKPPGSEYLECQTCMLAA